MSRLRSILGGGPTFDPGDEFVPEHLPDPGPDSFLAGHEVLAGREHVAFHRLTAAVFEDRSVYDVTFDYNLARLNRDPRHPDAGYRYAVEAGDPGVLRAEFTPTTPFCPQSHSLARASFRAWNGERDRHGYDLVRVRVAGMHQRSDAVNEELAALEAEFAETGTLPGADGEDPDGGHGDVAGDAGGFGAPI
jgi:hypothetical protein